MKRLGILFSVIFLIALVFFLLRGPYLSNSIKRVILPVLENAIGERIIINKAVINLFPFYIQTKGLKVFDEDSNRLLRIEKMRVYIDITGLLSKEIRIRRLTVKEPKLSVDRKILEKIIRTTERYAKKDGSDNYTINLKSVKITDGRYILTDKDKKTSFSGTGLYAEVLIKNNVDIDISLKEGVLELPGMPVLKAGFEGRININGKQIKIPEAEFYSSGSSIKGKGELYVGKDGELDHGGYSGEANILAKTVSSIFGLNQDRDGVLSFSGSIDLVAKQDSKISQAGPEVKIDLKTKGWFYLETLMGILKVDENITGRISLDGRIHGVYPELTGESKLEVTDIVLDTLQLDDIKGEIKYRDKKFTIDDFMAHTYGGELKGRAFLVIPDGDYFVDASVEDVNSKQFFRFIEWEPPFPGGKVGGTFTLDKKHDKAIKLTAKAAYLNTSVNIDNLLNDRLKTIKTELDMEDNILTFRNSILSTELSDLLLSGTIDLNSDMLHLNLQIQGSDVQDFTGPYFTGLSVPVTFTGKATGSSLAPEISGNIKAGPGTINGEPITEITADLTYLPELLIVRQLKLKQEGSTYDISGSIAFRKSSGLFMFDDPYYSAEALIENADAESLIAAIHEKLPISGLVSGNLSFKGDSLDFKGNGDIILREGMVFGQPVETAVIEAELLPDKIHFSAVEIHKNKSDIKAVGDIYFDERFNVSVSSDVFNLQDLAFFDKYPFDANLTIDIRGSGTFKNPDVQFSFDILESYLGGASIGRGNIKGGLKDKKFAVKGELPEGVAAFKANAVFSESLPWDASIEFKKGRYDFLLAGFLDDVPRDVSASIEGYVRLKGKNRKFTMDSNLSSLSFSLYGYNFKNKENIVLELTEDTFWIRSLSIRGGNGDITASGFAKIEDNYDLKIDGKINLTPLKAVTKKVESLKGSGSFSVAVSGPWDSPELRGKISIRGGSILLAGLPYGISSVNGDIFLDKDRITFDSFGADFATGRISVSGSGRLKNLVLERLSLSSEMEGIKLKPFEEVDLTFDGRLFFERSPDKQNLIGDINIKRARYAKRVEWKSELLKLGQTKEVLIERPSFLGKTSLNIYITGRENILIDNNIARTPVKIDVNIQGTMDQYGLVGRLDTDEGKMFFRGNEFEIIDGSVDFVESNRIVPVFHIQAETFVKGYRVRLNLDGPSENFTLSLFSDPPLDNFAIMTLLTSGQISREKDGIESGIGAGEATAFLTGRLQDVMEERFKTITGFERFEVDPHTTSTGAVSSKITVGKRMLDEKLIGTYSSSIGSTDLDEIKLQYNLTKKFSIIGSRNEIGSVGADFKYRFEFK